MLFYYIRHGEPIYSPDMLTPHGEKQAEALSERLIKTGLDKIYTSTSKRAMQTAEPTCKKLGLEPERLDFANEHYAWLDFSVPKEDGSGDHWAFHDDKYINLFTSPEIRKMGDNWFDHPAFEGTNFKNGIERVYSESDRLFASLGYVHERYTGRYKCVAPNDKRVALFAHQGFGLLFLSCLLDIPYPQISTRFDMCHTGITLIQFRTYTDPEYCIPRILSLSDSAHLMAKDIPSDYVRY